MISSSAFITNGPLPERLLRTGSELQLAFQCFERAYDQRDPGLENVKCDRLLRSPLGSALGCVLSGQDAATEMDAEEVVPTSLPG
jgi:hypothetical protein